MATLSGQVLVDGLPRNGATVKLFSSGAPFSTNPPAKNTAFPASGQVGSNVTSGTSHGGDGAYRFTSVTAGTYYAGADYNGTIVWDSFNVIADAAASVKTFGAVGDGVTNDTTAIQTALNDTGIGRVFFPPGTYLCGNLTITNRSYLVVEGEGATILWTGTAGAGNQIGIQLVGSNTGVEIRNLNFSGDSVAANGHAAVWWKDTVSVSNLLVTDCRTTGCIRGVSGIRSSSGTWRGITIENCLFELTIGTGSSQGECVYLENNSTTPVHALIRGNVTRETDRYDVHLAGGIVGVSILGNRFFQHRNTAGTGSLVPSVRLSKCQNVLIDGNVWEECKDGSIEIVPVSGFTSRNVSIIGNQFLSPGNALPEITIGTTTPATDGTPEEVIVKGNLFYQSAKATDSIRLNSCLRCSIEGNQFVALALAGAASAIRISGSGDSGGTATYSNGLRISDNLAHGALSGGTYYVCDLQSAFCTSIAFAEFHGNRATSGTTTFLTATAITNTNVNVAAQEVDGLTFATTTAPYFEHYRAGIVWPPIRTESATYAATDNDEVIVMDTSGGSRTINLPAVAGRRGKKITGKRVGANALVLDGSGAETIDGAATKSIDTDRGLLTVQCDGDEWHIIGQSGTIT